MAWWKSDPRVAATHQATDRVRRIFGSPATPESSAEFELAAAADELVDAVLGGLRRGSISTAAVLGGRTLGARLLVKGGITDDQVGAVRDLLDVLSRW